METQDLPPHLAPPPGVKTYVNEQGMVVLEIHTSANPENIWMPLACPNCGEDGVLCYRVLKKNLQPGPLQNPVEIRLNNCPFLVCQSCDWRSTPLPAETQAAEQAERALNEAPGFRDFHKGVQVPEFPWAEGKPFKYDPWEHRYMPGLYRGADTFLTPVYFRPEVLQKYKTEQGYRVEQKSDTYGLIRFRNGHPLAFGINRRGSVIAWLGDVGELPDDDQYHFLSYNIASEGDVSSDFYHAQINLSEGTPSKLSMLLAARRAFVQAADHVLGQTCTHLNAAASDLLTRLTPPTPGVIDSELEVIEKLTKLCVETIRKPAFVGSLAASGVQFDSKLGSMKVFQLWLEKVAAVPTAETVVSPLFVLYDLRLAHDHLHADQKKRDIIAEAGQRLGLPTDSSITAVYDVIVMALTTMYQQLAAALQTECGGERPALGP